MEVEQPGDEENERCNFDMQQKLLLL